MGGKGTCVGQLMRCLGARIVRKEKSHVIMRHIVGNHQPIKRNRKSPHIGRLRELRSSDGDNLMGSCLKRRIDLVSRYYYEYLGYVFFTCAMLTLSHSPPHLIHSLTCVDNQGFLRR